VKWPTAWRWAGSAGDRAQTTGATAGQGVEGGGGGRVGGEVDDQALVVIDGEFEGFFVGQAQRADIGMGEAVSA
jgi:hypothetical protein